MSVKDEHKDGHEPMYYVKIWAVLLVLLVISIIGPEFGIEAVTLITAFGIAVVKAWIVATRFMHLNVEKPYISYILGSMLLIVVLFFAGVSADVMRNKGVNWINQASFDLIEQHKNPAKESGHGSEH